MGIFGAAPALQTATVTTSATQVFSTAAAGLAPGVRGLTILNAGPQKIYVGQSSVTASTGVPLAPGHQMHVGGPAAGMYAITSSGTSFAEAALSTYAAVL